MVLVLLRSTQTLRPQRTFKVYFTLMPFIYHHISLFTSTSRHLVINILFEISFFGQIILPMDTDYSKPNHSAGCVVLAAVGMSIAASWEVIWCKLVDVHVSQAPATSILHEYPVDAKAGSISETSACFWLHVVTTQETEIFT